MNKSVYEVTYHGQDDNAKTPFKVTFTVTADGETEAEERAWERLDASFLMSEYSFGAEANLPDAEVVRLRVAPLRATFIPTATVSQNYDGSWSLDICWSNSFSSLYEGDEERDYSDPDFEGKMATTINIADMFAKQIERDVNRITPYQ